MATRIVVGLVGLAVVLSLTWLGGLPFVGMALAAAIIGGYEFYWMLRTGDFHPQIILGLLWIGLLVLGGWQPALLPAQTVLTLGFIVLLTATLFQVKKPLNGFVATAAPAVYLGTMFAQMIQMRQAESGLWLLLLSFGIVWANDTIAYFVGVTIGRHKIWPRLSPKKSWEGTVAGWLGAAIVSVVIVHYTPVELPLLVAALLGLVGGVLGFFGDLSISMVKRQVGVKDSGHFFPGHGGMLDRLDSMLFVIPFVYQAWLYFA